MLERFKSVFKHFNIRFLCYDYFLVPICYKFKCKNNISYDHHLLKKKVCYHLILENYKQ